MADNTILDAGAGGDTIATDDVTDGGVANAAKVQRVKAGYGSDNNYADPTGNTGAVDAGTQRVTCATDVDVPTHPSHTRNEAFKEAACIGGELDDAATTAATEGNVSPARITAQRAVHANLRNNAGTEIATAGNPLRTDPTGSTTQPVSAASLPLPTGAATAANQLPDGHNVTVDNGAGAAAVNVQDGGNSLTVDAASLPLPTGAATEATLAGDLSLDQSHTRNEAFKEAAAIGGELDDTATTAATEGNVSPARITAQRALHANLRNDSGTEIGTAGAPVRVDPTGSTTQPVSAASLPLPTGAATAANQLPDGHNVTVDNASGATSVPVQGAAAHDAAAAGNPVLLAGEARTTTPTAVGDGDAVRIQCDDQGRVVTSPLAPRDLVSHATVTRSVAAEADLIAAGGAGVFLDLVSLVVSNGSSGILRCDIKDSSGGTVRISLWVAADGGGAVFNPTVPLPQATANNPWRVELSGAPASNDVRVTAIFVQRA